MKILIFGCGSLSVAAQEVKLSVEFAKMGHEVYLLCNPSFKLFDEGTIEKHDNLKVFEVPYSQYKYNDLESICEISPREFDVCFGMDQSVSIFVAEFKQKTRIKSFCMFLNFPVHVIDGNDAINYNPSYSQRFYYWINCALELDGIIFNNTIAVEEFYKRYKRDAHLVWYSISNDNAYEEMDTDGTPTPSKDYILGCNRLIKYKGTELAIQALKKLPYNYKHIFVSGDDKELETLKKVVEINKKDYTFYNCVGEDDKMEFFYNAKLIVYPQITEWVGGLSIIEGMSVKTPGLCFDYPVLRELYGDCVLYAKKRSVIELRENMKTLYEDEDLNKELSEKGYERFKKYFTRKIMAENLIGIFNEQ